MKTIAIFGRTVHESNIHCFQSLITTLEANHFQAYYYQPLIEKYQTQLTFSENSATFHRLSDIRQPVDFLISIGGDGTFLDSINLVGNAGIPIMGINLGNLGFLASVRKDGIEEAVRALQTGDYDIDNRTLLHIENGEDIFDGSPYGLNEVVIFKRDYNLMLTVDIAIDGKFLNRYYGDGLLISTSTGSTAYNLSAGGPILLPDSENLIITPLASHTLTVRPLIVPDKCIIQATAGFEHKGFNVSIDSRVQSFDELKSFTIRKENFNIKTIRLKNQHFFDTIRTKLMWGADVRKN